MKIYTAAEMSILFNSPRTSHIKHTDFPKFTDYMTALCKFDYIAGITEPLDKLNADEADRQKERQAYLSQYS